MRYWKFEPLVISPQISVINLSDNLINQITLRIIEFGQSLPRFSTGLPEADELVYCDNFAFLIACCLDRGMPSEIIWRIPYFLKQACGHLDPERFSKMSIEELSQVIYHLPVRPRYTNDAPYTIIQLATIITNEFGGKAENLWIGHSVREIYRTLRRIRGVGEGIANMTINLLHRYLNIELTVDDLRDIDVKPDVHVERVFQRTGLSPGAGSSVFAARLHSPNYPAALDLGAWTIGKNWCHAKVPNHEGCPIMAICPKIPVE
ncbi:MAG: hypothetical protein N3A72_02635 [bacterium]|nr:hypothetical protein [bacterium]